MPKIPTFVEMLQAGVHFGHQKSKWHPRMEPYIFAERNGIYLINLIQTQKLLEPVLAFVREIGLKNGVIIFVGSKKQAQEIVKNAALSCGMPYVTERWLGGTLTNFSVISRLIQKFRGLQKKKEAGELVKYTKKEQLFFDRQIERLSKLVGGISSLEKQPDALFLVDMKKEKTALAEAQKTHVPIVAFCDTNANPEDVQYPIPANDDATRSIQLITGLVASAINEGREEAKKQAAAQQQLADAKKEEMKIL